MATTLAELSPGQQATILSIDGDRVLTTRLLEMGLTPGETVTFVGTALLGDPLEIQVRGYRLSLRRVDAAIVQVQTHPSSDA